MREHAYVLLKMLERVEYEVEDLEANQFHKRGELEEAHMRHLEEVDELQRKHDEELERQQECIDTLEEEVQFQWAMLNILNNNVKWLEPESTWRKHAIQLQEMLEQVESHVTYLKSNWVHSHMELKEIIKRHKAELDEMRKKYEEDLESYCDHIDDLEEELDVLTNAQRKEIEDFISLCIQDEIERYQANAIIRDKIINLMDHTLL
ncbi:uncharacterized protein BJ212DRAFT_1487081 [Suillus subaureus]|uniref:Uncharacterized protein n=1 Tax=Suillus subaureus TaxID=48587 RepID=A0A9P7DUI5_9AGAM|nr:uncharacterized protein BJ212DRAFT_1487081 [Suillus subaureus]KAG1803291.1 hypothetical protein BJ212DRAFT_1487081 [Suillus subaureus]